MIELLSSEIDHKRLYQDMDKLLSDHNLWSVRQISLTSVTGADDWDCSIGRIVDLPYKERMYSEINYSLKNTYIAELIEKYKKFYRWRLLHIPAGQCYSVHRDALGPNQLNKRIHIPVQTNDKSFFCYHNNLPAHDTETTVSYHHLEVGKAYEVDTTGYHSAINYGKTSRYHIVGVRYKNRDNDK
jgi:hypothetical protein